PSVLPQCEHRLDQRAVRADQTRYAKLPELVARIDDVRLAAREPVKPSNERRNRPIREQATDMLDSVDNACMPASRHDDESITSVDDQRLLVEDRVYRKRIASAHQIPRRQFLIAVVRARDASRQGKSRPTRSRLG